MKVIRITNDGDEITRYGFVSHMEDYLRQLLSDPLKASVGDYLMSHGIDNEGILPMLLHNPDKSDENNAILIRTERIKTDPETGKDRFCIKYKMPRKDFDKKMRRLFINLFENYHADNELLNEEGECGACDAIASVSDGGCFGGGATNCSSSGQYVQPLDFGGKKKKSSGKASTAIIRRDMPGMLSEKRKRTVVISESQLAAIKEEAVMNTPVGDFGYDAPVFAKKGDPTLDHKNIMAKSFPGYKKRD